MGEIRLAYGRAALSFTINFSFQVKDKPQRIFGMGCRQTDDCIQGMTSRPVCPNWYKSCPRISAVIRICFTPFCMCTYPRVCVCACVCARAKLELWIRVICVSRMIGGGTSS